mmetsp:Transcript_27405/g.64000  ORF Transcript_27405/g.64000 Transcript_27405/m.64000 type:complete len:206 (-) Transcript_27405:1438-2055(-)
MPVNLANTFSIKECKGPFYFLVGHRDDPMFTRDAFEPRHGALPLNLVVRLHLEPDPYRNMITGMRCIRNLAHQLRHTYLKHLQGAGRVHDRIYADIPDISDGRWTSWHIRTAEQERMTWMVRHLEDRPSYASDLTEVLGIEVPHEYYWNVLSIVLVSKVCQALHELRGLLRPDHGLPATLRVARQVCGNHDDAGAGRTTAGQQCY